ncbi:MAG: LptF/LptG family permease [Bacteroidota bacterium]
MKIIDRLLIKSFVAPFSVTFFIAIFVLIMQFLWKWIDDIAGKGVGVLFILEMLGYMCISLIPLALPIAVLISSVMVMGNLAERYELSSFKSAGVSLARVMLPLMFLTAGISLFSYFCSDKLIPISNLKYQSRLYDIKNQKPTMSLEQGVFNDDFQGYSIRIGKKLADNQGIEDVLMYDQSQTTGNKFVQIKAKSGEMNVTADERFLVMKLYNGVQYMESKPNIKDGQSNYPFVRTSFDKSTKVLDLGEFQLDRTDENLFKTHHNMLSTSKLIAAIDSIENKRLTRIESMGTEMDRSFHKRRKANEKRALENQDSSTSDSIRAVMVSEFIPDSTQINEKDSSTLETEAETIPSKLAGIEFQDKPKKKTKPIKRYFNAPKQVDSLGELRDYATFYETFQVQDRPKLLSKAKSKVTGVHQSVLATIRSINRTSEHKVDHLYHLHNKFSTAVACFIFLFVGAPMGAIVRKGGFGYPLLISVVFFVTYIMMTILFKKMMEGGAIDPVLGAWMPCVIILPIGIFLTIKAMNDSKLLPSGKFAQSMRKIVAFFKRTFESKALVAEAEQRNDGAV